MEGGGIERGIGVGERERMRQEERRARGSASSAGEDEGGVGAPERSFYDCLEHCDWTLASSATRGCCNPVAQQSSQSRALEEEEEEEQQQQQQQQQEEEEEEEDEEEEDEEEESKEGTRREASLQRQNATEVEGEPITQQPPSHPHTHSHHSHHLLRLARMGPKKRARGAGGEGGGGAGGGGGGGVSSSGGAGSGVHVSFRPSTESVLFHNPLDPKEAYWKTRLKRLGHFSHSSSSSNSSSNSSGTTGGATQVSGEGPAGEGGGVGVGGPRRGRLGRSALRPRSLRSRSQEAGSVCSPSRHHQHHQGALLGGVYKSVVHALSHKPKGHASPQRHAVAKAQPTDAPLRDLYTHVMGYFGRKPPGETPGARGVPPHPLHHRKQATVEPKCRPFFLLSFFFLPCVFLFSSFF